MQSNDFDNRLKDILSRKASADQTAKDAADAARQKESERQQRQQVIRATWREKCVGALNSVFYDVRERSNNSIHLEMESEELADTNPALARLNVGLILDGKDTRKGLSFNVSNLGIIQVQEVGPSLGGTSRSKQYQVETFDRAAAEELILGFLEKAV